MSQHIHNLQSASQANNHHTVTRLDTYTHPHPHATHPHATQTQTAVSLIGQRLPQCNQKPNPNPQVQCRHAASNNTYSTHTHMHSLQAQYACVLYAQPCTHYPRPHTYTTPVSLRKGRQSPCSLQRLNPKPKPTWLASLPQCTWVSLERGRRSPSSLQCLNIKPQTHAYMARLNATMHADQPRERPTVTKQPSTTQPMPLGRVRNQATHLDELGQRLTITKQPSKTTPRYHAYMTGLDATMQLWCDEMAPYLAGRHVMHAFHTGDTWGSCLTNDMLVDTAQARPVLSQGPYHLLHAYYQPYPPSHPL